MNVSLQGSSTFRYLDITLESGDKIITEAGAMATMSPTIEMKPRFNGGFFKALLKKFLGGESLFINEFSNSTKATQRLTLTAPTPGDIQQMELKESSICLQPGAYICSTPGLALGVRWAGLTSFIAREGLFKLVISGTGTLWFGSYGEILEKKVEGDYIVDSGHLVAYDPTIALKLQLSNGIVGSVFSGEGFVTRLHGNGRVFIQTRSMNGFASWLNPKI